LRADRHDLRQDGQAGHVGDSVHAQSAMRKDGKPLQAHNTQLTPNALANNAANNSKNAQKQQATHKSWTHWIW
jgi:hypothetical protein